MRLKRIICFLTVWLLIPCGGLAAELEVCDVPADPVRERLANRGFPSVFAAWGGPHWTPVLNLPEKTGLEHMALHDLYFCCIDMFAAEYDPENKVMLAHLQHVIQQRQSYLNLNPDMIFIAGIPMRAGPIKWWGEDWEHWLRYDDGSIVYETPDHEHAFIDFTRPSTQQYIADLAIAISKCGFYDGIFIDWWHENTVILAGGLDPEIKWGTDEDAGYRGFQAEQDALDNILKMIRAEVRDEFLILVNGNRRKIPRTAWAINGTFMETGRDHALGYTRQGLYEIESTLRWAETHFREPRINCLEGWGIETLPADGELNKKWMRVFTTMALTHSDGFVLYNHNSGHQHNWYDFWNSNLGRPLAGTSKIYQDVEGLFIREFTNGWAVYNRSGLPQTISLPVETTGVASQLLGTQHTIPDLDGEIYLKTINPADLNADGTVNILDLVIVANALGENEPDLNGDGTVNILDLVIVANAFE